MIEFTRTTRLCRQRRPRDNWASQFLSTANLTAYVLVLTSAIHVTIPHAVTSNFFGSLASIAVEVEDIIELVAHLLHANNIIATRARYATE
jgi:succinate dehydrogenase hydrophobic anchor subunit